MGRPKPLLVWGDETLIEYQVSQLRDAGCDPVIVVLGAHEDAVRPLVRRAGGLAVINELYAEGRASSVRVGAGALGEELDRLLILNVDQPRPAEVHRCVLEAFAGTEALIAVPTYEGRRGHPVVFESSLFPELREVREATEGMREVMQRHETDILEVPFETAVVTLDMNRPEDYEAARVTYFEKAAS
jgi:molybdenum cofactor cytidylyltransferase